MPVITEDEPEPIEEEIFTFVEEYPEFPGGDRALREFILNNIQYPEVARTSGITGTVYVQFVVEKMVVLVMLKLLEVLVVAVMKSC